MIWIIIGAIFLLSIIVQAVLKSKIKKYSKIATGLTGAEAAMKMLQDNGIYDVTVNCTDGFLTDHYNPQTKQVNLSTDVYNGNNIASVAIAAHECGHAVQHARGYAFLKMRSAMVPIVNFANNTVQFVLLLGIILLESFPSVLWAGIALFALTTLFSFVTLPVEINASARAVRWLDGAGIITYETKPMAVNALKWAAYTYVIAAIGSLATLIYYITIASRR
ncbi:MAG: zinc metallopeptidase [Bacteroidales bacterium]|nr:zinc metallopeptidase [Bacteroidales bacterium]